MNTLQLKELKNYCKNKSVVIVGNSSSILESDFSKFIDSHDVVVRMNYAYPVRPQFMENIGRKTDVYVVAIQREKIVKVRLNGDKPKFILRLNPCGENLNMNNVYYSSKDEYSEIKSLFGKYKPSTGSLAINFFKKYIDYKNLNIIGFDFFEKADKIKKNPFKSFLYKDHSHLAEKRFITKCLDGKTKFIKT